MRRTCLCLLLLIACVDVGAREVRLSSPDSGSCSDAPTLPAEKAESHRSPATRDTTAPRGDAHVRPSVHSDAVSLPRMRWHSFLPGMFR